VINQIMDDPSMLALGGEKRELTAMFTDVKGFSSISEVLDPTDLVQLLNEYLSAMSDVVLELRGTIDKFEGDAIISFFGAPVPFTDHPMRACTAAVRMKKIEKELNTAFLRRSLTPTPLATRIGINTGEMVVGNMGTATRMDYTIMGNAVNLAARLEGVNKQYGTWILTSQYTIEGELAEEATAALVTRQLDRVRVVGINEPVRLYEVLDIAGEAPAETTQLAAEFHSGLAHFEHRQWSDAARIFSRILEAFPEDGPGRTYAARCDTFMKEEPQKDWDGVFNLTQK
jgi:adenylate cyclase